MKIIQGEKTIIKSWCENPEQGAIDQMLNLAKLPFVFKHKDLVDVLVELKPMAVIKG